MELKKLTVHNYKSLVNFELIEPNAFTVFAGPNGAGKSNIFEALEFFSYGFTVGITELENLFGGRLQFVHKRNSPENYRITFEFSDFDVSIFQELSKSSKNNGFAVFDKDSKIYAGNFFLSNSIEKEEVLKNEVDIHEHYFEKFLRLFIKKSELNRIKYTSNERLLSDASNLESVLKRILKEEVIKEEFLEWLDLFIPGFSNIEIHSDNIGGTDTLLLYEKGSDKPFTKNLISDGTYNILALLTAVYQTNEPQFICIEEPENGLNPYVVQTLVDFFRKQCEEKGHVIWLNTHSQTLVSELRPEELVLIDKVNGETRAKQFSKDYNLHGLEMDTAWLSNALGGGLPW